MRETPQSARFAAAVKSGEYRYLAMGGSIGSMKSFTQMGTLCALHRIFPGSRSVIVRKDLPTIKRTTIPTFEKLRPRGYVAELNRSDWLYRFRNGSEILLFPESLSEDPDLNRWKGLEVNFALLEQAEELAEKTFYKAIERVGRWVIPPTAEYPNPAQPPPLVFLNFNPAEGYTKTLFYEPHRAGTLTPPYYFQLASIADNPFLPAEYIESLKSLPPKEYARFVLNDWSVTTDPDQLIDSSWIIASYDAPQVDGRQSMGIDVARFGDDCTVFCYIDGNCATEFEDWHGVSTDRVADFAAERISARSIGADNVRVDVVGLGAGVVDNLRRKGFPVREIESGGKPVERSRPEAGRKADPLASFFTFKNLRSQMWWEFREKLRTGRFALRRPIPKRLFEDLTAPRYAISGEKVIEVESKDDIKKRLGRSTDYGDALVYAAFDLPPAAAYATDARQYAGAPYG